MNRDFDFYMANAWVEAERMFKFKRENDKKNLYGALQRFIDLVANIQKDKSVSSTRRKEINRLKEYLLLTIFWEKNYLDENFIKKYFSYFYMKLANKRF